MNSVLHEGLGYTSVKDAVTLRSAPPGVAAAYNTTYDDGCPGPDDNDLRLDFASPLSSRWNQAVMTLLVRRVEDEIAHNGTDLPTRSFDYLLHLVHIRLVPVRQAKSSTRRQVNSDGERESDGEIVARIKDNFDRVNKQSKRYRRIERVRVRCMPRVALTDCVSEI